MTMNTNHHTGLLPVATLLVAAALLPLASQARDAGAWQTAASVYVYLPSVSGRSAFPTDGGTPIQVGADQILDSLKMTFMGTLDLHNGRWGAFTDVLYIDLGNQKSQSRDFSIGNFGLPAGSTADLGLDLKAWVWTLAGQYRVVSEGGLTMDLIGGARMLDITQRLDWAVSGSLGALPPVGRAGTAEVSQTVWDGIFGVKGRYVFGAQREWSLPYYLDVGTGGSTMTWQAAAGVAYGFRWGELSALYRSLDYDMKSGKAIQSIRFSGPMLGATFRW